MDRIYIRRKNYGENDIDTLCLQSIHNLMKDGASRKKLSPRDVRALKRAKTIDNRNETVVSNLLEKHGSLGTALYVIGTGLR